MIIRSDMPRMRLGSQGSGFRRHGNLPTRGMDGRQMPRTPAGGVPLKGWKIVRKTIAEMAAPLVNSDAIIGHVASWGDRFPN